MNISTYSLPVLLASHSATIRERTLLNIVWSCFSTLFLCTWVSVHPNMPATGDAGWRILWRRLKTMYWALIAPELVLIWAIRQLWGARQIYNKFKGSHPEWTMTHAHFLQMGGFHYQNGNETSVLYPEKFCELIKLKEISFPSVTKEDIQDRSKADGLSKMVVGTQTLWFGIQCIERLAQKLALTQLEVATLAVISCTFLLSAIWWHKPLDVKQPIYLEAIKNHGDHDESSPLIMELHTTSRPSPTYIAPRPPVSFFSTPMPSRYESSGLFTSPTFFPPAYYTVPFETDREHSEPAASSETVDVQQRSPFTRSDIEDVTFSKMAPRGRVNLARIYILWRSIVPLNDFTQTDPQAVYKLTARVPSYYAFDHITSDLVFVLTTLTAILFGLIHCIAWNSEFPSSPEKALWRISAVGLVVLPTVYTGIAFGNRSSTLYNFLRSWEVERYFDVVAWDIITDVGYILFRLYILIESLLSLRALPPSAFQTIAWSDFIPHL